MLRGFPGVSSVDADGDQVDNLDPDVCRKTPVWGIRVFPPDGTVPLSLPMADQDGCAGDVSPFGDQPTAASVRS